MMRVLKFTVAGLSVVAIGLVYDLKQKIFSDPLSGKKEQDVPSKS